MAFTFVMQNIAANLGGMLTPFGNPQNLYIYSKFNIPTGEFMSIMALPFAVSIVAITAFCLIFVKAEPLELKDDDAPINRLRAAIYLALFVLSIVIVFRVIPFWIGLIVIPLSLLRNRHEPPARSYSLHNHSTWCPPARPADIADAPNDSDNRVNTDNLVHAPV